MATETKDNLSTKIDKSVSIEKLIDTFELSLSIIGKEDYRGTCPVHSGDNHSSFHIFKNENGKIYWNCHSHHCETEYGPNIIGLVSGILKCDIKSAIKKIKEISDIKLVSNISQNKVISRTSRHIEPKEPLVMPLLNNDYIIKASSHISQTEYFDKNGIPEKIIKDFELGYDIIDNRIVIPIYDHNNRLVGWSGRYVDDEYVNTIDISGNKITKFKIHYGTKKASLLYGAHLYKNRQKYVVLAEGFKDVWMLYYQGISCVGVCGNIITSQQLSILKQISNNIVICFDNDSEDKEDNPGQIGAKKTEIILKHNKFNVINIVPLLKRDLGTGFIDIEVKKWINDTFMNINFGD